VIIPIFRHLTILQKKSQLFFLDSYYFLNVLISTVHITAVCIYGLFLVFEYIIIIISTLRS